MLAADGLREAAPGTTRVVPDDPRRRGVPGRQPVAGAARRRHRDRPHPVRVRTRHRRQGRRRAPATLQRIPGARAGRELHERAHGIDRGRVVPNAAARSLAAERPFARDELDPARHRRALLSAAEELGARLRARSRCAARSTLTVRYADRSTTTRTRRLAEPTAHSAALTDAAYRMYEALGLQRARVRAHRAAGGGAGPRRTRRPAADLRPGGREGPPDRGGRGPGAGEVRAAGGDAGRGGVPLAGGGRGRLGAAGGWGLVAQFPAPL